MSCLRRTSPGERRTPPPSPHGSGRRGTCFEARCVPSSAARPTRSTSSASTTTTRASGSSTAASGSNGIFAIRAACRSRRCCARRTGATARACWCRRRAMSAAVAPSGSPTWPTRSCARAPAASASTACASTRSSIVPTGTTPITGTAAASSTSRPITPLFPARAGSPCPMPRRCGEASVVSTPPFSPPSHFTRILPCRISSSSRTCAGTSSSSVRSTCCRDSPSTTRSCSSRSRCAARGRHGSSARRLAWACRCSGPTRRSKPSASTTTSSRCSSRWSKAGSRSRASTTMSAGSTRRWPCRCCRS